MIVMHDSLLDDLLDWLAKPRRKAAPKMPPPPPPPRTARPRKRRQSEERQAKVAAFVEAYRERHGRDPAPRDVRAATGLPRATAHRYQQRVA